MNFSKIFSQTWKDYKLNFKHILKFMLIFLVIPAIIFLTIGTSIILSNDNLRSLVLNRSAENSYLFQNIPLLIVFTIMGLITLVLFIYSQASLISTSLKKKSFNFQDLINSGRKSFWRYFVFNIFFITFIGLLFLLLIIPGIIFLVYWVFGVYVMFDQDKGILKSLKESRKLVKGKWWRVLGYSILLFLIFLVFFITISLISFILLLPLYIIEGFSQLFNQGPISSTFYMVSSIIDTLAGAAQNIIAIPFGVLFFKNLYLDFKKSKK